MFNKRLSKNKKTELVTKFKESPKVAIDLFSTIDKSKIPKPKIESDGHYYIVKEIVQSIDGLNTIHQQEHKFSEGEMYHNKIEARLFYDNKHEEILMSNKSENTNTKLELYLIRNSDLIQEQKILLIDSNGVENIENKKLESFLLSSMGTNKIRVNNNYENSISTKNSFLDGDYKD